MSPFWDGLTIFYFAVAAIFCLITWFENQRVFYVSGPPSGVLTGLFWPFIVLAIVAMWWLDPMRKAGSREAGLAGYEGSQSRSAPQNPTKEGSEP